MTPKKTVTLHPYFDPTTNTWYVTYPYKGEAPTISELIDAVQGRHPDEIITVQDFYPLGTTAPKPKYSDGDDLRPKAQASFGRHINKAQRAAAIELAKDRSRIIDPKVKETVLDLWEVQSNSDMISKVTGLTTKQVRGVVVYARQQNDPRAVRRLNMAHSGLGPKIGKPEPGPETEKARDPVGDGEPEI